MKKLTNWLMVLAACVGAFYGVGLIVPRQLTTTSRVDLGTRPDDAVTKLADVASWPQWFPEVTAVREQTGRNGETIWRVTKTDGRTYDLESSVEERVWQASYTFDHTSHTLRFSATGFGDGARVQLTRTTLTHDTWRRAMHFLFMQSEPTPLAVLNALAEGLGEHASAKDV